LDGSLLYPTWLCAIAAILWGTLSCARLASLGAGNERLFPTTPW